MDIIENFYTIPIMSVLFFLFFLDNVINKRIIFFREDITREKDFEIQNLDKELEVELEVEKYEDKYWDKFIKMENKYMFNEETNEENEESINNYLDKLDKNFIFEKTPVGNVIMFYNNKRKTFDYYSDNTIPYRYLETISRKYVITYFCKPLYVVMTDELKKYEDKLLEKERIREEREKKMNEEKEKNKDVVEKKNVFAKFKSYNKEAGTGRVNIGVPPKNSIPNMKINDDQGKTIILKELANNYSYQGKIINFSIIKKIDRKAVDKKYAMTFADFKKMKNEELLKNEKKSV